MFESGVCAKYKGVQPDSDKKMRQIDLVVDQNTCSWMSYEIASDFISPSLISSILCIDMWFVMKSVLCC